MRYRINLQKILHYLIIATVSTFAVLAIGYLTPTKWHYNANKNCEINIYVFNSGIHTEILVPVQTAVFDWRQHLSLKLLGRDSVDNYNYLSFGWGERDFFLETRIDGSFRISTAFKALFFPNNLSAMHVQGYQVIPDNFEIKCVRIRKKEYLKLMQFINNSFALNESGNKIRLADGYHDSDGFYAAKNTYSILRNCNNWTAEGLRLANVNTPLWSGLSSSIMLHWRSDCKCK